jgi:hypothetical protein
MTSATRSSPRPRRRAFRVFAVACAATLAALAVLAALIVSDAPSVPDPGPPDAATVAEARALAGTIRDFVTSDARAGTLSFDESEVSAALSSARRVLPGLLGRFRIDGDAARVDLSMSGSILPDGRWINVGLGLGASPEGLDIVSAHLGRVPLPPALVLPVARFALDRHLGDGLGGRTLDAISGVAFDGSGMRVSFAFPEGVDTATFFDALRARLRVIAGGDGAERVHTHLWHLHETRFDPDEGLIPFLRHAVAKARDLSDGDDRAELESALFALALYCGDQRLGEAAGIRPNPRYLDDNACRSTPLGGRQDLRQHFTVSAGLYAMRSDATVLGVGELKELLDSGRGGSGFSLDDMAANAAGVRFAAEFLDAPPSDWAEMLDLVGTDDDILPPLDGLESGMTEAEFSERYGDVDSPAYQAAIAEIGRRIDALPLYSRNRLN